MKIPPNVKELSILTKDEWYEYTKTVWKIANVKHELHPTVFPVEVPKRLTKLYSFFGETVLDPFGGVGSTAVAAIREGRRAICFEQNPEFVKEMQVRIRQEGLDLGELEAHLGDARNLSKIEDCSIDLIVTSPPYWDLANYGKSHTNLATASTYTEFLKELRQVFEECSRVLRPGRKICVVVASIKKKTEFGPVNLPLNTDIAVILRAIGLKMITEIIWSKEGTESDRMREHWQKPIFGSFPYPPNLLFRNLHDYIIVFEKPKLAQSRGVKVRTYDEIMGGPLV